MTAASYSQTPNTGIAFDQSAYLERIASALETLATNSTTIKDSISNISTNTDTIAANTTTLATNSTTLTELGQGTGIHMIGPWDWIGLVSLYKLFIEEGKILELGDNVSPSDLATAIARFEEYIDKIRTLPTMY